MGALVVGITGSPASGKSSFAMELSHRLNGAEIIELNEIVKKDKLVVDHESDGTAIADLQRLSYAVREKLRHAKTTVVLVGHLLPELGIRTDITIVVRASLSQLRLRMKKRGYSPKKISENIVCEAIDYCGCKSDGKAREVYEVETQKEKAAMISYIVRISSGSPAKKPAIRDINKMKELELLIRNGLITNITP